MIELVRTDSSHPDFVNLVKHLDAYLAEADGAEHAFYDQFNKIDHLNYVVLVYSMNKAVGCGAIQEAEAGTMEIKRMFVQPDHRGRGIASVILSDLEKWSMELHCFKSKLETGRKQQAAVRLYMSRGYDRIPNYGQYKGMENSLCFEKELRH
ncbi:MAG: GNAT family N-acetyltransferase [Bacteroidia bacterium]